MCHFIVYNFQGAFMMLYSIFNTMSYVLHRLSRNETSDDLYVWHKVSWLQIQIMWRYRRSNTASLSPSHMYKNYFTSNLYHEQWIKQTITRVSWFLWYSCHVRSGNPLNPVMCFTGLTRKPIHKKSCILSLFCVPAPLFWSKENHPVWLVFS